MKGGAITNIVRNMKRKGTEGSFGNYCRQHGFSGGCDPRCIAYAKKQGGIWAKRANAASIMCKAHKGGGKRFGGRRFGGKRFGGRFRR